MTILRVAVDRILPVLAEHDVLSQAVVKPLFFSNHPYLSSESPEWLNDEVVSLNHAQLHSGKLSHRGVLREN